MQINNRPAKAPIYDPRKYQRGRMIHKRTSPKSYVTSILFLEMASNNLTSKPNTEKLFTLLKHSKQDSASVAPLRKHNSVHQDDPTKATILNEQFQSVLVGSLLTASAIALSHETTKTVLMQTKPCESLQSHLKVLRNPFQPKSS